MVAWLLSFISHISLSRSPLSSSSASPPQVEGSSGFEEDLCSVASDSQDSLLAGAGASSSEVELGSEPSTPLRSRGPSPSQSAEDVSIKEEDDDASLTEFNGAERSIDEQSVESLDTGIDGAVEAEVEMPCDAHGKKKNNESSKNNAKETTRTTTRTT